MTDTGHKHRTQAVVENLRRRSERVVEKHTQSFPTEIAEALLQMADKMNALTMEMIDVKDRLAQVEALEEQVEALTSALTEAAADRAQLLDICRALDDRISSFAVKVERAA